MASTTTSNYLPVLIAAASSYPLNSNTTSTSLPSSPTTISSALPPCEDLRPHHSHHPPAHDDSSVSLMPRSQVDYLSHNWEEEDVWRSWRNMTRQKNEIANGIRLENASWRTWWKQRNGLGTVTPETLNWLKDSDVTWLYGPLHTAGDQYPVKPPPSRPLHPPDRSSSSTGSIASTVAPAVNGVAPTKPILKHRSISQQLTSDLPPTFPALNTSVPAYTPSTSSSDSESELLSPMDTTPGPHLPSAKPAGRRPSLQHTKSESYVTKWGPDRRFRKESPPRIEPPHSSTGDSNEQVTHDGISHISESTENTTTTADSSPTDPGIVSSTNSSDSNGQITQSDTPRLSNKRHHHNHYGKDHERKKKKHISFNTYVEQCIAIETPQPSPSSLEGLAEEVEDMDVDIDLDQGDRQVLGRSIGRNANGRVVRIEYRDDDDDDEDSQDDDMGGFDEDSALRFQMGGRGRYAMGRNPWGAAYDDGYDEDEEEGDDYEDGELGEDFSTMWGEQQHQNPPTAPHQHITAANSGPTLNTTDPDENRPDHRASNKLPSARSHSMVSTASSSSTASSTTSASTVSTTSTTSSNSEYSTQPLKNRPASNRRLSNSTTSTYRPGDNYSVYAPDLTGSRGTNSSSDSGRTSRGSRRGRAGSGSGSGSNNSRQMVGVGGWKVSMPPNSIRSPSITIAPIAPTILKTGGTDGAPGGSGDFGDYFTHQGREWAEGFGDEGSDGEYRPFVPDRKEDTTRSGNTSEDGTSSTPVELVYVPPPSWGAVNAQLVRRNNSREVLEDHEDGFGNAVEYDATPRRPGAMKMGRKIFSVGDGDNADGEVEMVEDTLLPDSRSYTVPSVVVRRTASLGDVSAASSSVGTDPRLRRSESYSNSFGGPSGIGSGQGEERRSRSRSRSRTPSPNLISSIQPELSTSPSKGGLLTPPVASSVPRSSSYSGSFPSSGRESSSSSSRTRGRSTETRGRSNSRHLQSSSSWSSERDRGVHSSSSVGSSLSPDATGSLPTSGIVSAGAYSGGRGRDRDREGDRDKRSAGSSWSYSPGSSNASPGGGERERGRDRTGTKRLKHSLSPEDISTREREKERMGRSINAVLPPPQSISPSSSATSESSRTDDRTASPTGSSVTSGSVSGSTIQDGSSSEGPVPHRPPMQSSESSSSTNSISSSSTATVTLGFHTPVSSPTLPEAKERKNSPSPSSTPTPVIASAPAAPVPIPVHQAQAVDQLAESVVSSSITSSTDSNYMQDAEKQRSQMPTPSNSPIVLTKMPRIVGHTTPGPAKRGSESSPARTHTRTGSAHRPPLSVPAPHVAAPIESPTTSAINVNTTNKSRSPSAAEAKAKSLRTKSPPISPSNSNSTSTSTSTVKPPSSSPTVENIGPTNTKPATPPSIVITSRRNTQSPPSSPTRDGLVGKAVEMVSHVFGLWSKDQLDQRQLLTGENQNDA